MNTQEEETKVICIRAVELERLIRTKEVTMYNAHDLYTKYEPCWDCKGRDDNCDYFRSQYLTNKLS